MDTSVSALESNTFKFVTPMSLSSLPPPENYEAALAELEQLIQRLSTGQLPLDQLLNQHERGMALLAYCRSRLQAVEDQIRVVQNGQVTPWQGGQQHGG
ncbi:MAG: Exodeoxyribonuclease 7 small subunit [Pseudomonadota bacterium]|jgi:exodeoxyribonuclease VII small subunit